MSVATEIARIQQAKADLKTAIEAKGVTVPTSAKLDDYPDLVEQISGGGYAFDLAGIKLGTKTTITKNAALGEWDSPDNYEQVTDEQYEAAMSPEIEPQEALDIITGGTE